MGHTMLALFLWVVAYLAGSLSSAVIVSRVFDLPDPRTKGSKNPGATNVLRLAGKKYALLVLVVDMLKGLLPVLLAKVLCGGATVVGFTCFAAVMGHMFPVFFRFHGGKGVATAMGALLGFHFILGVTVIATWLLIVNFTRYVSFASLISLAFAPLYAVAMLQSFDPFPPLFFITLFVFYKHRDNITRLMDGEEPKLVLSAKPMLEGVAGEESVAVKKATKKSTAKKSAAKKPAAKKPARKKVAAKPKTVKSKVVKATKTAKPKAKKKTTKK